MRVNFIAQPQVQLGTLLTAALNATAIPTSVVLVSAFASLQAVLRLKARLCALHAGGAAVRMVVGVDMGGTSKEVLKELASWPIEVYVFKNRKSGVTFHPKLYIVEAASTAEVFLGSNNLTDGGLYGNYEGAVRVSYALPAEAVELTRAKTELSKFINPAMPVGRRLDADYLQLLLLRRDIPDEAEARIRRKLARGANPPDGAAPDAFGFESTPGAPSLPMEVKNVVIAAVQHQLDELAAKKTAQKKAKTKAAAAGAVLVSGAEQEVDIRAFAPLAQIAPAAFYLELTTTDGNAGNIPGEQRVPLEALHAAHEFWGWPDSYAESVNPRKGPNAGGIRRVYLSRKPLWRVRSAVDPAKDVTVGVRMYYVVANSDFRFHSGDLKNWAQAGDLVRIVPIENQPYEYECTLAVAGTPQHAAWAALCGPTSGKSPRMFGYS
jgi:HKD family nuclease